MRETLSIRRELQGWLWTFRTPSPFGREHRAPHTHVELEFNLTIAGHGQYVIGGSRYELEPGTLIWLFPEQPHVLLRHSPDFMMHVAVFRPGLVERLCRSGSASTLASIRSNRILGRTLATTSWRHLSTLCEDVIRTTDDPAWFNVGMGFLLRQAWATYESALSEPQCNTLHPAVARATQVLSTAVPALPLSRLASQCGLSYSRLCRVFKRQMGISLLEFRNQRRLETFHQLFNRDRRRTILDCALEAGFGSYAHFHRVFRDHLSVSPRDYYHTGGNSV